MLKSGELDIALSIGYEGAGRSTTPPTASRRSTSSTTPLTWPCPSTTATRARPALGSRTSPTRPGSIRWKGPCGAVALRALQSAGFEPTIVFETDDYLAVQGFVAAGMGVRLLPEMALEQPARGHRRAAAGHPGHVPADHGGAAPGRLPLARDRRDARHPARGRRPSTSGPAQELAA